MSRQRSGRATRGASPRGSPECRRRRPWSPPAQLDVTAGTVSDQDHLIVADFNGDGISDLVSASRNTTFGPMRIVASISRGPGAYDPPASVTMDPDRRFEGRLELVAVDIDGNGTLDIAILNGGSEVSSPTTVFVASGAGDGSFGALQSAFEVDRLVGSVGFVDLDLDGRVDLYVSQPSGGPEFAPGLGQRRFGAPSPLFQGSPDQWVSGHGDFDGDGWLDLIVSYGQFGGPSTIHYGDGALPFGAGIPLPVVGGTDNTYSIEPHDLDGDGDLDLVHNGAIGGGATLQSLDNEGGRVFGSGRVVAAVVGSSQFAVGDVDQDGRLDLVSEHFNDALLRQEFVYVRNEGSAGWGPLRLLHLGALPFRLGETNGDGILDVVAPACAPTAGLPFTCTHGFRLGSLNGLGDYGVGSVVLLEERFGYEPVGLADVDHDGLPDLLIIDRSTPRLTWRRQLANGGFAAPETVLDYDLAPTETLLGDVNGGGFKDVLYRQQGGSRLLVRFADAGGGFGPERTTTLLNPTPTGALQASDLDNDGIDDVVWASSNRVVFAFGQPTGIMTSPQLLPFPAGDDVVVTSGDVDGDGDRDLLALHDRQVYWVPVTGPQTLGSPSVAASVAEDFLGFQPAVADANNDGILDLFFGQRASQFATQDIRPHWLIGLGGGAFAASPIEATTQTVGASARYFVFDADLDGDADVLWSRGAFSGPSATPIDYLENLGDGTLATGVLATPSADMPGIPRRAFGDVDADGDPDLLVGTTVGVFAIARNVVVGELGFPYCGAAATNAAGLSGAIGAVGSSRVVDNDVTLRAMFLPPSSFGYFLASMTQGLAANPAGSIGVLCLGGAIGRFSAPSQIRQADTNGAFTLAIDLTQVPSPSSGFIAVAPGESWSFQAWYRDRDAAGQPSSNFTDGLEVPFR